MQVTWLEFYSKLRKENVKVELILNELFKKKYFLKWVIFWDELVYTSHPGSQSISSSRVQNSRIEIAMKTCGNAPRLVFVLSATHVFLLFASNHSSICQHTDIFHMLTNKSSSHSHGTCYSLPVALILSPFTMSSRHCHQEMAQLMPWSWCQDDKATLVLHWIIRKNVSLPFLTYSLRETGPRQTSLGPRDGQHYQCGGPYKLYSQPPHPPFHRTQTSGPGARDKLTDSPKSLPSSHLTIKALFLGPACAWLPCLSEQVLTKEALGLCHGDGLACHFLR